MFLPTSFGDIIYPCGRKLLFIDLFYGNIVNSVDMDNLQSPSSVIMNEGNNVTNSSVFILFYTFSGYIYFRF